MIEPDSSAVGEFPLHRFGLAAEPFAENIADAFFFPSDQHLRALEFLGHALWTRARLSVVIADHGCGKSFVIQRLCRAIDERFIIAVVQREQIGPREFLTEILNQYGMALDEQDKTDRRRLLLRFLTHQASLGRVCVLVVENAQSMHPSVLEELRALAAVEADGAPVLKLLLLGQPTLNLVLQSPRMGELVPPDVQRFVLGPLSEDQTAAYVAHRLRAAGATNPDALFAHTLTVALHAYTGGVPKRINQLCEQALSCALRAGATYVSRAQLEEAVQQLNWSVALTPEQELRAAGLLPTSGSERDIAKLLITMQNTADREATLHGDRILVGRGEEADVRIDSVFVSRYHALIVRDGKQDVLLDLGSTNGVLVNSRRMSRRVLHHRDLIQIGPARLTYLNEAARPTTQPDPGDTVCIARPGMPAEDQSAVPTLVAFGRLDTSGGH